jgi:predicted RNA-binding Zn-ribbon protein involved in translation (DUF1610 family)
LDIENSPHLGHVWGLWQQNISLAQLQESAYVMCYAAKWLGEEFVFFDSLQHSSKKKMMKGVHKALKVGQKIQTIGHELWTRCMAGDKEAWAMMEEYNINDVVILEEVYQKMLPWIKGHANHSLYNDDKHVCPNCGSHHLQKRGYAYTLASMYQRYKCKACGHWSKDSKILNRNQYKMTSVQ